MHNQYVCIAGLSFGGVQLCRYSCKQFPKIFCYLSHLVVHTGWTLFGMGNNYGHEKDLHFPEYQNRM